MSKNLASYLIVTSTGLDCTYIPCCQILLSVYRSVLSANILMGFIWPYQKFVANLRAAKLAYRL